MPAWEDSSPASAPEKEVKVQVNIGPGLADKIAEIQKKAIAIPNFSDAQKAMADLLSKTVEELAAGEPQASSIETISVRGDNIILPKTATLNRHITQLFACLYALENPKVDRVLRELGLNSQFLVDGKVVTRRLIPDMPPDPAKSIQAAEEKPVRNIVIGDLKYEHGKDVLVAVLSVDKIGPMWLGTVSQEEAEVMKDGLVRRLIRPVFGGVVQSIPESDLIPIRTEAQLAEIFNSIASQK